MSNKPRKKKPMNRQQIMDRKKNRRFEDVPVPGWDGDVRLQCLSANEIFLYQKDITKGGEIDEQKALGLLVVRSIVDDQGVRQFKDEDAEELLDSDSVAITILGQAALKLNKIKEDEIKKTVKNS